MDIPHGAVLPVLSSSGFASSGSEASQHRRIALARGSCTSVWQPRGRKDPPENSFANSTGDSSGEFSPSNVRPDPSIAEHHARNRGSAASDVQNLLAFTLWSNLGLPQITLAMQQSYCNITPPGISRNPGERDYEHGEKIFIHLWIPSTLCLFKHVSHPHGWGINSSSTSSTLIPSTISIPITITCSSTFQ